MAYNTKIKNNIFYNEFVAGPGGGTAWELSIDPDQLKSAATEYTEAATNYNSALDILIGNLNKALEVWSDKSAENWTAKIGEAKTNLQAVSAAMNTNSTILTKIADAASATETSVFNGIKNI